MSKNKKNDEKLIRLALITVMLEIIRAIIELIIKLIELVGAN